ncbi:Platelet-derived growth factor receptor alpha [Orchesella cincta]|uniref:Platelet-derived growth factor receptor alpha n=1 Tax=Orchesella cincta TaxID=48709 RepID=A0A1D2NAV6_ORCCI|nr:Platelet-derived growth factor receptor alpha [Orchesella cincta]
MVMIYSVFRPCFVAHFIVLLIFPLISTETTTTESIIETNLDTGDGQVCGTVTTASGDRVELKEGVTLSETEFEKVHLKKLKGAIFSPVIERECVIKLCGFTSFTSTPPQYSNSTLLGSSSDYADCEMINKIQNASATIYNDVFNTSSIGCGCNKKSPDCILNCFERVDRHIGWKENECAILFQESFCKTCDFNSITIEVKKEFVTDNTHHIRSALVRDNCSLTQNITGLNRLWRFQNESTTLQYSSTPTANNVKSAFLSDPETFWCYCNVDPPEPPEPEPSKIPTLVYIVIALSTILGIGGLTVLILMWRKRKILCGAFDKKRGSDYSNSTHTTNASRMGSWGSLDYSQIMSSPFDPKFSVAKSQFQTDSSQLLGGGHFGEVFKGSLDIAIKSVKVGAQQMCYNSLQQEIKILSHLGNHENVVRFYGFCAPDYKKDELYLITELCTNGSLKSYLQNTIEPRLKRKMMERQGLFMDMSDDGYTEEPVIEAINFEQQQEVLLDLDSETSHQFLQWAEEIANGMRYITHRKIVHVDLAARNVLLNHNLTAKIGDFGLSRKIYIKDYEDSKKESLPIMWIAPEALMQNKYFSKSDVWSYGVTIWEVFSLGKDPYTEKASFFGEILGSLMNGERLNQPHFAPDDVYSKLNECWNLTPEKRPSFKNLRDFFYSRKRSIPIPIPATILGDSDTLDKAPHVLYSDI